MASRPLEPGHPAEPVAPDFSLVLGGPLFQLLRRAHLSDDALHLAKQRILVITLLAWLPLLVLSIVEGEVLGGKATVPFLLDVEVHVRFLIALPLLIAAELVVHQRMRSLIAVFLERHLIPPSGMERFKAAITSAQRLRNSLLAEVVLIILVYGVGVLILWRHYIALNTVTWYGTPSEQGSTLSLAGIWYGYVSLPLFQFLLLRWYFRFLIWFRFLWQVSRIDLSVIPTHPDRNGGLGFLNNAVYAFSLIAFAHGALLAGYLANRIFFVGASLPQFKVEIAVMLIFMLCVILGPLLVFAPQLASTRRLALREYGTLAEGYVRAFHTKWLRGGAPAKEQFLGSTDIQSLADLGNSYELVRSMRAALVTKEGIIQVAAVTLAPIVPLGLTMMPLEQLVKSLLSVLL
jgi:hypothetical protein